VTDRPSQIVGDALVLNAEGAAMLAAALRLAAKAAGRNGVDFKGRAQYDAFSWLLTQADLVASGSAAGNGGQRLRVDLPSSALDG
jgi:hypothetical protein